MRNREPRDTVELKGFGGTPACTGGADTPYHGCNTDIGHDNCIALSFREQNRVGWNLLSDLKWLGGSDGSYDQSDLSIWGTSFDQKH